MADAVVIAGGGPAGLATAIAARLRGFEVIVLERARPPIDKACGEGLMPDGVAVLERLGVDLRGVDSHHFRGVRYIDDQLSAEGIFPSSRPILARSAGDGWLELTGARREFASGRALTGVPLVVEGLVCAATSSLNPGPIL